MNVLRSIKNTLLTEFSKDELLGKRGSGYNCNGARFKELIEEYFTEKNEDEGEEV